MMEPYCDKTERDPLGNLICLKEGKGENKKKIMFSAHCDECGFVATYIDGDGSIRVDLCGTPDLTSAIYGEVVFENGVHGILLPDGGTSDLSARNIHVDIGAKNAKEAERRVRPGDFCAPAHKLTKLGGSKICGFPLDGRAACATIIKAASEIKDNADDIYFVFTSQETVGFRGAKAAVFNVMPDIAVNIDVAAGAKLGCGAAIRLKDGHTVYTRDVTAALTSAAEGAGVKVQYDVNDEEDTEAAFLQSTAAGAAVGGIAIPCTRLYTAAETVDLKDMECAVKLISAFAAKGGKA